MYEYNDNTKKLQRVVSHCFLFCRNYDEEELVSGGTKNGSRDEHIEAEKPYER